jgi:hypothetical protein
VFSGSPAAIKKTVFSGSPATKKENSVQRFTRYKKRKQCSAVHPLK